MALPLAAALIAAGMASCGKDDGFGGMKDGAGRAVEFTSYYSDMATKAMSVDADHVLGRWDTGNSAFVPGTGVGVFAFHQKVKGNGYPQDFNKEISDAGPEFMYNQKLERLTADGLNYCFEYSPKKYWPGNANDQLSFFAYAPYDVATAWEDLRIVTNLKGTKISRDYVLEHEVEDQTDFLWSDPVLNVKKGDCLGPVGFSFVHICSRVSVTAVANYTPDTPYLTVDTLAFTGRFHTSGTFEYDVATSTRQWSSLSRSSHALTYYPFKEEYSYNAALGRDTSNAIRVTDVEKLAHPEDRLMFFLPGIQDVRFHYALSQRNPATGDVFTYSADTLLAGMTLEAGRAYNFKLNVNIQPISISGVAIVNVDLTDMAQDLP